MPEKEILVIPDSKLLKKRLLISQHSSLIDDENYLVTDVIKPFCKKWTSLFYADDKKLDVSPQHPFTIILDLKYPKFVDLDDDLNIARVFLGIKDPQREYQESIEMGIEKGRIYIKNLTDLVKIPKETLVEGVQIVLEVLPNEVNKKCSTVLKVLDHTGYEITKIKTNQFLATDWIGGISPGAHFKSLHIEGVQI